MRASRLAAWTVALVLLAALGAGAWGWYDYTRPGPLAQSRTVIVPKGVGLDTISRLLAEKGIVRHATVFVLGARATGTARKLRAGEFAFAPHASMDAAARHLAFGQPVMRKFTIPEGETTPEALARLAAAAGLEGTAPQDVAEGALMPETYLYTWGDERPALVARMRRAMRRTLDKLWSDRASSLAIASEHDALVLASIIEKETAVPAERPMISAVFQNRLRKGMKLQSDPTVMFALTHGAGRLDRKLSHADLETNSPYNTYRVTGLPPGPIGNPGRASIEAALHPAESDALYFVADGTGGHVFAKTLAEHNRNVARWRKIEEQKKP